MVSLGTYTAVIERDEESRWWLAHIDAVVPDLRGLRTEAKTLQTLRRRLRDLLSLEARDAKRARIELRFRWKADERRALQEAQRRRQKAEKAQAEAMEATARAARTLQARGVSQRDAAELLGLSHQRIQQVLQPTDALG